MTNLYAYRRHFTIGLAVYIGVSALTTFLAVMSPVAHMDFIGAWSLAIGGAAVLQGLTAFLLWKDQPKALLTAAAAMIVTCASYSSFGYLAGGGVIWGLLECALVWFAVVAKESHWLKFETKLNELGTSK